MRWADNSMGSDFPYDWGGINQAFAAGKIGMYITGGSDIYTTLVSRTTSTRTTTASTVLPLERCRRRRCSAAARSPP